MYQQIIGGIVVVIAAPITIWVGAYTLGSVSSAFDCSTLDDYAGVGGKDSTGWAKVCIEDQKQARNSWIFPIAGVGISSLLIMALRILFTRSA